MAVTETRQEAVLIDVGMFIGALLTGDPRHAEARPLVEQAREGVLPACWPPARSSRRWATHGACRVMMWLCLVGLSGRAVANPSHHQARLSRQEDTSRHSLMLVPRASDTLGLTLVSCRSASLIFRMGWSKVRLQLDAAIDKPPQGIVLFPGGGPRGERAVTRLRGGLTPALLIGLCGGCIGLIDGAEPRTARLRMAKRAVEFKARAACVPAARHDLRDVDVRVERVELRQAGLVRVGRDIHADHEDGVRGPARCA